MDVRIKTKDFEMTDLTREYLDQRCLTIEKHLGGDADTARCEVEIGRDAGHSKRGENWFAEIQVTLPGSNVVRVVHRGETVNAAIDAAKDEILLKLQKDKTRRFALTRKAGAKLKDWLKFGQ